MHFFKFQIFLYSRLKKYTFEIRGIIKMAFDASKYTTNAKPLPVLLLLDVSGSMDGSNIAELNKAVSIMINEFKKTVAKEINIVMSVITFSNGANIHIPMTPVENIVWHNLSAGGGTNLSAALYQAKSLIEDRNVVPSRAYRPAVILVSDGYPNYNWEKSMKEFIETGRSSKCDRMAMLIGESGAASVMNEFLKGSGNPLFFARDANDISKFFKFVTMTTTTRTLSQAPNTVVAMPTFDKENMLGETVVPNASKSVQAYSGPAATVAADSDSEDDDE